MALDKGGQVMQTRQTHARNRHHVVPSYSICEKHGLAWQMLLPSIRGVGNNLASLDQTISNQRRASKCKMNTLKMMQGPSRAGWSEGATVPS